MEEGLVAVGVLLLVQVEVWVEVWPEQQVGGLVVLIQAHWGACLLMLWEEERQIWCQGEAAELACWQLVEIPPVLVQFSPFPRRVRVPSLCGSDESVPLK